MAAALHGKPGSRIEWARKCAHPTALWHAQDGDNDAAGDGDECAELDNQTLLKCGKVIFCDKVGERIPAGIDDDLHLLFGEAGRFEAFDESV